jgi:hypothetical protein
VVYRYFNSLLNYSIHRYLYVNWSVDRLFNHSIYWNLNIHRSIYILDPWDFYNSLNRYFNPFFHRYFHNSILVDNSINRYFNSSLYWNIDVTILVHDSIHWYLHSPFHGNLYHSIFVDNSINRHLNNPILGIRYLHYSIHWYLLYNFDKLSNWPINIFDFRYFNYLLHNPFNWDFFYYLIRPIYNFSIKKINLIKQSYSTGTCLIVSKGTSTIFSTMTSLISG